MTIQKGKPEQLRMFMSAHEITQQYAPNEADRYFHGTDISVSRASGVRLAGGTDPRAGEWTGRDRRTDNVPNNFMPDPRGNMHPQRPVGIDLKGPWAQPETDEQMYQRKLSEATNQKRAKVNPYGRGANRVVSIPTLTEDIRANGVQQPIALGQHESPSGRPSVAGGHHRLAVMQHLNPHQLLPVVHVMDVTEANESGY